MADADILALGEPLIELLRLDDPVDGRIVYAQGVGGDTLNAMVAAARQGARAGYLTAVGDDPFGEAITAFAAEEGIDTAHIAVRTGDPTGVCFIHPDPQERRFFYARRGSAASHYRPGDLPEAAIAGARVLHISAITLAISPGMRAAAFAAAETAREGGGLVAFDLNLRLALWSLDEARAAIEAFLPLADIVLPSDDEAALLTGQDDPGAILDHFGRHGAAHVVLKRGAKGVVLATSTGRHEIAAPKVEPVDSTGAGDSFAGAFLAYLIETGDSGLAAARAVRVAAGTVCGLGATAPIPTRAEVLKPE
ncbi:MAG: sugar kinase [Paracoccaceae bacterium]|nr:sugar kinase [Paracoccaceae bacterium]